MMKSTILNEDSTSGMSFPDAVSHAKKHGHRVTYGTQTRKWHTIDKNHTDYHAPFALDPDEAKRHGMARSLLMSTQHRGLKEDYKVGGKVNVRGTGINREVVQEAFKSAKEKKKTPKSDGKDKMEVKGPSLDEKFQKDPILTPLTTAYTKG